MLVPPLMRISSMAYIPVGVSDAVPSHLPLVLVYINVSRTVRFCISFLYSVSSRENFAAQLKGTGSYKNYHRWRTSTSKFNTNKINLRLFLAYFLYFDKVKDGLWDHPTVCVFAYNPEQLFGVYIRCHENLFTRRCQVIAVSSGSNIPAVTRPVPFHFKFIGRGIF
jgi:hypothetical protein